MCNTLESHVEYTLLEGAKAAKVAKSTVLRAIKSGRLSARREEDGTYRIDASELARVYDTHRFAHRSDIKVNQRGPDGEPGELEREARTTEVETAALRVQIGMLEDQLARERQDREHERERMDRERETILQRERDTIDDLRRRLDKTEEKALALAAVPTQRPGQMDPGISNVTSTKVEPLRSPKDFLGWLLRL